MKNVKKQQLTDQMKEYIRTKVYGELIKNRCNQDDARQFVEDFINDPDIRQNMIDEWELETIRVCEHCGQPMYEGYLVNDCEIYCSKECVMSARNWSEEEFEELAVYADDGDNVSCYWTAWEG